ncbi:hypothetical protein QBC41DRAFT_301676 [Cercophora samala]|uniref:Uncharacterized protein n=1 Tax=Cercophora samala TaxID=330535 RepID=A0AA40DCN6_9PEZI|nr:hypothetical protein QBC41DRAFT_301676 [Cercophora samala]
MASTKESQIAASDSLPIPAQVAVETSLEDHLRNLSLEHRHPAVQSNSLSSHKTNKGGVTSARRSETGHKHHGGSLLLHPSNSAKVSKSSRSQPNTVGARWERMKKAAREAARVEAWMAMVAEEEKKRAEMEAELSRLTLGIGEMKL